jgi:ABC-type dipeptide/oligopeptide/nickel transport system permease subunit
MARSKNSRGSLIAVVALTIVAITAPWLAPHPPNETHVDRIAEGPTLLFPLGTDALGRCVLSRVLYGARTSLVIGLAVMGIAAAAGSAAGFASGTLGGAVAAIIEFVTDVFLSLPSLILSLAINGALGAGLPGLIVALAASGWMRYARVVRGMVLTTRSAGFVEAAIATGAGPAYIVRRHLLPHALPAILALAPLSASYAILNASALSFLGLGVPAPTAEWGAMLSLARPYMRVAPHLVLIPGLALTLLVAILHWCTKASGPFRARQ